MTTSYQDRKKAIKRFKRDNPEKLDNFGHIPPETMKELSDKWRKT